MKFSSITFSSLSAALLLILMPSLWGRDDGASKLTVEEGKFQMVQVFLAEKVALGRLRTAYPELKKVDEANHEAGREFREAVQNHPKLKARFEEIDASGVSIPEKMKLWAVLFKEAEKLEGLDEARRKYDKVRLHALRVEIDVMRLEGHLELVEKLEKIYSRIEITGLGTA